MPQHSQPSTRARRLRFLPHLLIAPLILILSACGPGAAGQHATPPHTTTPTVALDAQLAGVTLYVPTTGSSGTVSAGCLMAFNAQAGAVKWKFCPQGSAGTPAVANGIVYMAPEDGHVYAVDATTGAQRWSFQRTVGIGDNVGYDGYAAVAGQTVYVCSDGGAVYALNVADGSKRWVFTLPNAGDHIYTAPVVANNLVYVSSGTTFFALDAGTGTIRWQNAGQGGFGGVPTLDNGTIYVGTSGFDSVYAFDAVTGTVRWKSSAGTSIISRPTVGNGIVYVGSQDQNVYALDAKTGTVIWKFQTGGNAPSPLLPWGAAPTLDGATLYVGAQGGGVYALNAADGKQLWHNALNTSIDSAPAVADGAVFVGAENGMVYALRASDGTLGWSKKAGEVIIGSPVAVP